MIESIAVLISFAGRGEVIFIPKDDADFIRTLPNGMNVTVAPGTTWVSRDYLYIKKEPIQ